MGFISSVIGSMLPIDQTSESAIARAIAPNSKIARGAADAKRLNS